MLPGEEELFENLEKWKAERPDQAARLEQWIKTVREIDPDYEPHLDTSYLPYDRDDLHKKALNIKEQKKLAKAKTLQDLPMDEASRLARAKEMGFDVDNMYYHGTPNPDFSEFKKGSFFTKDSNFADLYSQAHNQGTNARVIPAYLKTKNFFDFENPEHLDKLKQQLTKSLSNKSEIGLAESTIYEYKNKPKSLDERVNNIINYLQDKNKSNWLLLENKDISKAIQDAGFDGTFITEAGRKNAMVFDPKNIRSKFAKFDPSMIESGDISSFVPKTTGEKAVGAALKGLGVLDKGLSHAGKLAIGADIAQGNIPEAAISAAEFAAPKIGAAATRVAPFLDLLRPETTQTEEQEQSELEQAKFNKLKQALKKRGLAIE